MTDRYHLSCWHVFCCLTRISAYAKNSYTRITRTSAFGYLSYRMGCRPVAGINLVGEISTSSDPGHTSLHARRISRLKSGWIRWNSTGLPAKHTITAHTELSMMLNKTVESTIPTMNPILKKQKKTHFHWHSSWSMRNRQEHGIKHSRERYKDWVTKVRQSVSLQSLQNNCE